MFFLFALSFVYGHGVVAAAAIWVAAQYTHEREVKAYKEAPFLKRFERVARASGCEAAARRLQRGNKLPIKLYKQYTERFHKIIQLRE